MTLPAGGTVTNWFVSVAGATSGPYPADHVVHWIRTLQIPHDAGFWLDGGDAWLQLDAAWPLLTGSPGAVPPGAPPSVAPPSAGAGAPAPGGPRPAVVPSNAVPPTAVPSNAVPPTAVPPTAVGPIGGLPAPPVVAGIDPQRALDTGALIALGQPGLPRHAVPQPPGVPAQPGRSPVHAVTDKLADFAGVQRVEGFPLKELLSATFRRYGRDEIERHFATGLPGFTPELPRIQSSWPKPWMFVRLLGGSTALFLGFLVLIQVFRNSNLLPGLIFIGSFAVPAAVLVFFFEVNTPRNVSLYFMIHCMIVGGVISLGLTLLLDESAGALGDMIGAPLAGFVEELSKLLAVFVVTFRLAGPRYPWILNGTLVGAAVGAGFAAFESAGYALNSLVTADGFVDLNTATQTIIIRALLAPFGHVVWTALTAGALWRVKLDRALSLRMLVHTRVLRMFLVVMALHALWNFNQLNAPYLIKYLVLGFLAWVLAIGMLQTGLKQIKAAQMSLAEGQMQVSGATVELRKAPAIGR